MGRFGRSKSRSKQRSKPEAVVPTVVNEASKVEPLSPKNDWITNVQALKHEYKEKGDQENIRKKRKDLTVKTDVDKSPNNEERSPSTPRSKPSKSVRKSPQAVKSPTASTKSPASTKSARSTSRAAIDKKSPTTASVPKSVKSVKSSKSPKSSKSSKSPRSPGTEACQSVDTRQGRVNLSKSAKSKSSKKYSSTLTANAAKAKQPTRQPAKQSSDQSPKLIVRQSPKQKSEPVEPEAVPMEEAVIPEENQPDVKERSVSELASTKRDTVLAVLAETANSVAGSSVEQDKALVDSTPQPNAGLRNEKRKWFGFRRARSKDPAKSTAAPGTGAASTTGAASSTVTEVRSIVDSKTPGTPLSIFANIPSTATNGCKSASPSVLSIGPTPVLRNVTSPLQLQLWLGAVKANVVRVQQEVAPVVKPEPVIEAVKEHLHAPNYYTNAQGYGVYVDYSTFDDGESVSSIDLLFKWLTCRDLGDGGRQRTKSVGNPEGMIVDDQEIIDSDVSFDADAQPRRRVLFSP